MATTLVRDSVVGDQWLQQTAAAVPVQRVIDAATGQPTGDILTGPVRLAFETLFELPQPSAKTKNPKFGAALLFTPLTDWTIFYEEYYRVCAETFAKNYDAQSGQYYGLHSPFRDQAEKVKFGGFTPGSVFMTCTSKFKPPLVDVQGQPILDRSRVYPGVWAICSLNPYAYNDPDPLSKRGVGFGLQSVMLIGDDTRFGGGGAPDTNQTFGAVKGAISAPVIAPSALGALANPAGQPQPFGRPPVGGPPMTGAAAPPPPGGTYAQPPAAGRPMMPPGPPARPAVGYAMPGQPAPAHDPRGPVPAGFASWEEYQDLMG